MQTIITAIIGVLGSGTLLAIAYKLGVGKKAGDEIQKVPDALTLVKPTTSVGAHGALVLTHYLELAAKRELSGDKLQDAVKFATTNPSPAQVLAYLETNLGAGFVKDVEASLPALARDELAVFGDHIPSVVKDFVGKMLPGIVVQQAQQVATAAQVSQQIAALAGAKAA